MATGISIALSLVLGYLLGSIPFAYIIGKLSGIDVRKIGDRNVGAFNVLRHGGLVAGIATIIADIGKGALAIVIAKLLSGNELAWFAAGTAAFIGHLWPVFLRFRGGVGFAVTIGVFLALLPRHMLFAAPLGIAVLIVTRNALWFALTLFVFAGLSDFMFHSSHHLLIYCVALSCLAGLTLWLKSRQLPPEAKKERIKVWVSRGVNGKNRGIGKTQ